MVVTTPLARSTNNRHVRTCTRARTRPQHIRTHTRTHTLHASPCSFIGPHAGLHAARSGPGHCANARRLRAAGRMRSRAAPRRLRTAGRPPAASASPQMAGRPPARPTVRASAARGGWGRQAPHTCADADAIGCSPRPPRTMHVVVPLLPSMHRVLPCCMQHACSGLWARWQRSMQGSGLACRFAASSRHMPTRQSSALASHARAHAHAHSPRPSSSVPSARAPVAVPAYPYATLRAWAFIHPQTATPLPSPASNSPPLPRGPPCRLHGGCPAVTQRDPQDGPRRRQHTPAGRQDQGKVLQLQLLLAGWALGACRGRPTWRGQCMCVLAPPS